eukprot:scaffold273243_cov33-Prasinocladus_malaysianus.AAC.2
MALSGLKPVFPTRSGSSASPIPWSNAGAGGSQVVMTAAIWAVSWSCRGGEQMPMRRPARGNSTVALNVLKNQPFSYLLGWTQIRGSLSLIGRQK